MKVCSAGATVTIFSSCANTQLPATGTYITCLSPDDCALEEVCANNNVCTKIGCQTYYEFFLHKYREWEILNVKTTLVSYTV